MAKPHLMSGDFEKTTILRPGESYDGPVQPRHDDELPEGSIVGNYEVEQIIGGGGGGIVYAARHRVLGRRVAIKILRREMASFPSMVTRFMREASAVNQIAHPNIVDIYEFGEFEPGRPYYVMEHLAGVDLRKLIQLHGRLSAKETLEILDPVCRAVQAAHDSGIIHRDIKANNIIVLENDGQRVVKLLDFGIAKMLHSESNGAGLTEPGVMMGTAHNMAPEQIRCERLDARADIYSLGILAFQMLTGQYPFSSDDPRRVVWLHLQSPPPRASDVAPVSPAISAAIARCLEKQPDKRFGSVSEFIAALREAVGEGTQGDVPGLPGFAVGIYTEVSTPGIGDLDDHMMEDMGTVLDMVEVELSGAGFTFPVRTGNSLLAVRLLETGADKEDALAGAIDTIEGMRRALTKRTDPHEGVLVEMARSVGQAVYRQGPTDAQIIGGSLLEVNTWTDQTRVTVR
jgi:hypothetical protein